MTAPLPASPAERRRVWQRRLLWALLPLAVLLALFVGDRIAYRNQVLRGVWAGGLALSGLPRDGVEQVMGELEQRLARAPVPVRVGDRLFEIQPQELGFSLDRGASVERALAAGRAGGVFDNLGWWLSRFLSPEQLHVVVVLDGARAARTLERLEQRALSDRPFAGGVRLVKGRLVAEHPRRGRLIDKALALEALRAMLARERRSAVQLPLRDVEPPIQAAAVERLAEQARRVTAGSVRLVSEDGELSLTLARETLQRAITSELVRGELALVFDSERIDRALTSFRKQIESPPQNARFVIDARDEVSVLPSRPGALLSAQRVAEAALHAAASPARIGPLPILRGAEPELDTEEALSLKIRTLVSRFSTFHPCCQPRVDNIHRIADLVDGMIVKPGQIVSLNAAVGPRTRANGFVAAPTIEEGEMVDSLGGGVSQFATTFFNALFHGGYAIHERQPHTYYFSRYPMGHEATLSWPKPDIIFENDTDSGMLIKCSYSGTSITVKIYGDNGGRKVSASRSSQFDVTKPPVELIANPELEPEEEKVKEGGQIGWSIIVGRLITYPDGKKKEEKRKVTYFPRTRRVEVHPCKIPEGEPGHTGEKCPEPELDGGADGAAADPGPPSAE